MIVPILKHQERSTGCICTAQQFKGILVQTTLTNSTLLYAHRQQIEEETNLYQSKVRHYTTRQEQEWSLYIQIVKRHTERIQQFKDW